VNGFLDKALAPGTAKKYLASASRYTGWAQENGMWRDGLVLLPSEKDLVAFCGHLASNGWEKPALKYGTILSHLSGLSSYWLTMVGIDPCKTSNGKYTPLLRAVLRGIRRSQVRCKKKAGPLTTDRLKMAIARTRGIPNSRIFERDYDDVLLNASCSVAVYGLLRIGEITSSHVKDQNKETPTHDVTRNLCWGDVQIYYDREAHALDGYTQGHPVPTHATIHLKAHKTDVFRDGSMRRIYATGTRDGPVKWLARYCAARVQKFGTVHRNGPFFVRSNGSWLTRSWFTDHLRLALELAGLDSASTSSHSCRAGGACSLLAHGASTAQVQLLGRWTGSCFLEYLALSPTTLSELARGMAQLTPGDLDHRELEHHRSNFDTLRFDAV
jgi:hypothetical protein